MSLMLKLLTIVILLNNFLLASYEDRSLKFKKEYNHEQRVALVVGNNKYKSFSKLKNPVNDARSIRDILKKKNFDVIYLENTTQKEFKKSIKKFTKKLSYGGVGLFYYAGHGIQVNGENYLIPGDAEIADKDDVEGESISIKYLTNKLKIANNRLNIIILDACRNDPFTRGGGGGLAPVHARGTYIAYATEAGKTAKDGRGKHGVFTKYLIKYMDETIPLDEVFRKTRKSVYEETNGEQFPGVYNQVIDGEFFFSLTPKKNNLNKSKNYTKDKPVITNSFKDSSKLVKSFLETTFSNKSNISNVGVNIIDRVAIIGMKPWSAYIVNIKARVKKGSKNRQVEQTNIFFSNGKIVIEDLINPKTGKSYKETVVKFKESYYKKSNLIYGNEDAQHRVVIFSDPLCPFCKNYVPKAINYMKKYPDKFAVYYYHFPLPSLHPASVELVNASIVAKRYGIKDVTLKLYKVKINPKVRDKKKILKAFNKVFDTQIIVDELESAFIQKLHRDDLDIASNLLIKGTPTVFFDGKLDKSKQMYKKVD